MFGRRAPFTPPLQAAYLVNSPVDSKLTPARGLPEARSLRMLARLGPACSIAADRQRKACGKGSAIRQPENPGNVGGGERAIGRDGHHRDERLHRDLFGEMAGRPIQRNQREHVLLIDRLHEIVRTLCPTKSRSGIGDQRTDACPRALRVLSMRTVSGERTISSA